MTTLTTSDKKISAPTRKIRLGMVGGGNGGLVGEWRATGSRLSNRRDIVVGAMSSNPEKAKSSAADWLIAPPDSHEAGGSWMPCWIHP